MRELSEETINIACTIYGWKPEEINFPSKTEETAAQAVRENIKLFRKENELDILLKSGNYEADLEPFLIKTLGPTAILIALFGIMLMGYFCYCCCCYCEKFCCCCKKCQKYCLRDPKPTNYKKSWPILLLVVASLALLSISIAGYVIDRRAERGFHKTGCAAAAAIHELVWGVTLITGEQWIGFMNSDSMIDEIKAEITTTLTQKVNERFSGADWLSSDKKALLDKLEDIYTTMSAETAGNPDPATVDLKPMI